MCGVLLAYLYYMHSLVPEQCDFWSLFLANTVKDLWLSFYPQSLTLLPYSTMPLTCLTSALLGKQVSLCHSALSSRWSHHSDSWQDTGSILSMPKQTSAYETSIYSLCFTWTLRKLGVGYLLQPPFMPKNETAISILLSLPHVAFRLSEWHLASRILDGREKGPLLLMDAKIFWKSLFS